MNVTNKLIKDLNPCDDKFNNYLNFYKDKEYSKAQFLGLKNITHSDKLWVAFRLMPKDNIRLAAADIAELVLPIFESRYPNDNRPRKAIEAARNGSAANAASCAARADANADAAARAAVYAANGAYAANADAAANAAYAAANAAYAAANAANAAYAAANAAYTAANAAGYAANADYDDDAVKKKIRTIVLKYWR